MRVCRLVLLYMYLWTEDFKQLLRQTVQIIKVFGQLKFGSSRLHCSGLYNENKIQYLNEENVT